MDATNFAAIASQPIFASTELCPWSSGEAVVELQELLNAHGYRLRIDGDFGSITETAVRDYQYQQKLRVDGVVGPKTWIALKTTVQPGTRSLRYNHTGADVFELQGLLKIQGCDIVRNGIFDTTTREAVIQFQHHHHLNPTGVVDRVTWIVLRGKNSLPTPPPQNGWIWNARRWV